jgi:enamine deaminase RidA (YjgF/YER057c/UK114 family)
MKLYMLSLLSSACLLAACNPSDNQSLPPPAPAIERQEVSVDIGYCGAVRVGDKLYISGCVGWGAMPDAVRIVYNNLERILQANGATFADVIKENAYTTDIEALKVANSVRLRYYNGVYPAATWVQVQRLFNEGLVLEVELVVQLPQTKH